MNISLEEQIEYMRGEVEWHLAYVWSDQLKLRQAILATLETVRDERSLAPTKPEPGP